MVQEQPRSRFLASRTDDLTRRLSTQSGLVSSVAGPSTSIHAKTGFTAFAAAPNRCWVADFTHVKTWSATVCVAFVVDTFSRRIVGWSAATVKETVFVLDALEMAVWQRDRDQQSVQPGELIHHSDAGSQYTSFKL
ncbi:Integrase core domain-containing protein, partial [Streptomyces sp. Ncost-T10-10d]